MMIILLQGEHRTPYLELRTTDYREFLKTLSAGGGGGIGGHLQIINNKP